MHPLLRLIASQPQWLAEHAQAYAELLSNEIGSASTTWKRRAALYGLAGVGLGVGLVLGGVALMLWGVVPAGQIHAPWALIITPLVPLVLAVACTAAARAGGTDAAFEQVRGQVQADMLMLREAGAE
jgi:hypothetical protein